MALVLSQLKAKGEPPDLEEYFKKAWAFLKGQRKAKNPITNRPEQEASPWWWVTICVILLVVTLIFSSAITVDEGQSLVVIRFSAYSHTDGPGLHFTIPFIDQRNLIDGTATQTVNDQGVFLTEDGNLVKASVSLNFVVTDPKTYVLNSDVSTLLQQQLQNTTLLMILTQHLGDLLNQNNWKAMGGVIQSALPDLSAYGIKVTGAVVGAIAVPDAVNPTFSKAMGAAQSQVTQMVNNANSFASSMQPLAEQKAESVLLYANAEQFTAVVNAQQDAAELSSLMPAYQANAGTTLTYLPLLLQHNARDFKAAQSGLSTVGGGGASNQNAYLRWRESYNQNITDANQDEENN